MAFPKAIFILFIVVHVISVVVTERIIGGHVVAKYSLKYQGSIQAIGFGVKKPTAYCGCTLISEMWAVSAAHCWRPTNGMILVFGEHRLSVEEGFEQIINVSRIYMHDFNYRNYNNDIMLLKLSEPAIINAVVAPAELPSYGDPPLFMDWCTVSGWGVTSLYSPTPSDYLRAVDVEINPYCNFYYWGRVNQNMLCAGSRLGGKDSCQGDSGGPLMCNGKLEGIVSWGIGCANPYFPGVYTRVRNYVGWIYWVIYNVDPYRKT